MPSPGTPQKPGATSPLAALASAARNGPPQSPPPATTRPRADSLLPRSDAPWVRPPSPAHRLAAAAARNWRRGLGLVVVAVALTMSVVAVWPVLFSSDSANPAKSVSAAQEAVATDLLRTVVGSGRTLWSPHHSFAKLTPATLSAYSYRVPVVASTKTARSGAVSLRVNSASVITLATPADAERCVFARDEPGAARTRFVTVRTRVCRASAAPATGWGSR